MKIEIRETTKGKTEDWLARLQNARFDDVLDTYAQEGVSALSEATPIKTGKTAQSWRSECVSNGHSNKSGSINWYNDNTTPEGESIALLIQYGHATGTGGYVPPNDFINPALEPILDETIKSVWERIIE